ncbi:MAG: hypothetical protein H0Z39_11585 [Peptococcaceae bacterium]|nr:hypothetical protein [Peptococcaceae bacterium]
MSPKCAVISVGKDNDYGHPRPEALAKLANTGVQVCRTDLQGTTVATSEGKTITFNKKASPIKERAPDESTQTETVASTAQVSFSPVDAVKIVSIDLEGEITIIKNTSGAEVDISAWKLVSEKGDQTFVFSAGTRIPAGGTLKVVSGPNA